MSELVIVNFISLDGVIQSPLSADEDRDGGFDCGGWVSASMDETIATTMSDCTTNAGSLLLGRRTYEIFTASWQHANQEEPAVAALNRMPKYVASRTITSGPWANTTVLGPDMASEIARLKDQPGGDIIVFGSGGLIQTLIEHDLIDRYKLLIFPLVIGQGKRMFPDGGIPANLRLSDVETSSTGVIIATYQLAGRTAQ